MSEDTIKIHKLIGDELVPLEMKRQRFEKTVDRIDEDVLAGASKKQILAKYAEYIVSAGKAADKPAASTEAGELTAKVKQEIVQKAIDDNPKMTLGEIVKHISAQHNITPANARYIASKLMK